ncbi:MAG: Rieske 2Fe-2S domain-containing protein [Rubrobacter sp.]|nr:Rieske 2Fe-2S domain-containing protein [Rubrobacter sp.]
MYGDQEIQELSPEVPRSQEEFDLTNAVWLSWKAPILEQGDQGNSGDTIGVPERPAFLDEKREGFTPEEISEVEESLNILSNSCAHLGCPVRWIVNADGEGEFLCPCHGGIYDINGNWYGGPPPRGMYRYTQFEVRENGRLYIKHAYDVEEGIPGISTQEPYVV